MSHFTKSGNTYNVIPGDALDISDKLPGGNYLLKFNDIIGAFYLESTELFDMPSKLYGEDITKKQQRIINTFIDRKKSTGILLSGDKGSGKSLLAKSTCNEMAVDYDMPVIIINTPYNGDTFNKFMADISQQCVILFDEFEKVYSDQKDAEAILTLLDGTFSTNKLFILTVNNENRMDSHLFNRPGRIYYVFRYDGLGVDFIKEYCEDLLIRKEEIDNIVNFSYLFDSFNFDMLKAIVEELNRYDDEFKEVISILNTKPASTPSYNIRVSKDGKTLFEFLHRSNLFTAEGEKTNFELYGDDGWINFSSENLVSSLVSTIDGVYTFKTDINIADAQDIEHKTLKAFEKDILEQGNLLLKDCEILATVSKISHFHPSSIF